MPAEKMEVPGSPRPPGGLERLVRAHRGQALAQPGPVVDRKRWIAALPEREAAIRALPEELNRTTVREFVAERRGDGGDVVGGFIATQIWGYGRTGYGAFRLARALAFPGLPDALERCLVSLGQGLPVEAFRDLCVRTRIPFVGTSFGSKYLYMADPRRRSLILDSVVAGWIGEHAGLQLSVARSASAYEIWLDLAHTWARELALEADELEVVIFSDALGRPRAKPAGATAAADVGRARGEASP